MRAMKVSGVPTNGNLKPAVSCSNCGTGNTVCHFDVSLEALPNIKKMLISSRQPKSIKWVGKHLNPIAPGRDLVALNLYRKHLQQL